MKISGKTIRLLIFAGVLFLPEAALALEVETDITADTVWGIADSPVIINRSDFTVQSGAVLTIEPGVTVRVSDRFIVKGTLAVNGEAANPVRFEERDEDSGWSYLKFDRESTTNPNRMEYAEIRDLEYIWVSEQSAAFSHCTVIVSGDQNHVLRSFGGLYKPYPDLLVEISDCFLSLDSSYSFGFSSSVSAVLLDGTDAVLDGNTIICKATAANTIIAACRFHETNTGAYGVEFSGNTVEVRGTHPDIYETYGVYYEEATGSFSENTVIADGPRKVFGLHYAHNPSLCRGNRIFAVSSGGGPGSYLYGIYSTAHSLGEEDLIVDNRIDLETERRSRHLRGIFTQTGRARGNRITGFHAGTDSSSLYGIEQQYYSGAIENNSFRLSAAEGISCRGVSIGTNYNSSNTVSVKNNIISAPDAFGTVGIYRDSACQAAVENSYNLIHHFDTQFSGLTGGPGTISADPLFADTELHLDSGSPGIDAGDPNGPFENEPLPNGGRINLGAYGNTAEAARALSSPSPSPTANTASTPTPTVVPTSGPLPTSSPTPPAAPTPEISEPSPSPTPLSAATVTPQPATPTATATTVPSPSTPPPTSSPHHSPSPTVSPPPTVCPTPSVTATPTPVAVTIFRPDTGLWAVRGRTRFYFGVPGDLPFKADYNGDGTSNFGIFREDTGLWAIRDITRFYFGGPADIPVRMVYSGAGCPASVFRPLSGLWAVRGITRVYFGTSFDQPVPGDYDGDGTSDPALFRPDSGLWIVRGVSRFYYGRSGDIPVSLIRGEGEIPAVFRSEIGLWALRGRSRVYYGRGSDCPVPGDYDGDGSGEIAIFREENGLWAVRGNFRFYFGRYGDLPVR